MVFCTQFVGGWWSGGGHESRYVGRVYSVDGAVHGTIQNVRSGSQDHHPTTTHLQTGCRKPYAATLTSNAPDDGRMRPKYVELRKLQ